MNATETTEIGFSLQIALVGLACERPRQNIQADCVLAHHYAVVALSAAGSKLRGWDFKRLEMAIAFADRVREKYGRIEIWSRDEFARVLARRVPDGPEGAWKLKSIATATCRNASSIRFLARGLPRRRGRLAPSPMIKVA